MNPRYNEIDYAFMHETEDEQALRLDNHRKALINARQEHFNAKHAMIKEQRRVDSLELRGIRHKNKMHKFHERVRRAHVHLLELEESPLTHMMNGMQNEPATID